MPTILLPILLLALTTACSSHQPTRAAPVPVPEDFGVVLIAHGGSAEWNAGVEQAVAPLRQRYPLEIAFGMADPGTIQRAVSSLEGRGIRRIGVVRLFISGESWLERTEQILGLAPGAARAEAGSTAGSSEHQHGMQLWQIDTKASFAVSVSGLAEAETMGAVLADRVRALSRTPAREDVLILAHGPGDDAENQRWTAHLAARARAVSAALPFRRVEVMTLREDWPEKRAEAERRIRAMVTEAGAAGVTTLVIPFRVQGFGPYAEVLKGLEYVSDGQGLVPHPEVTRWIESQIELLQRGPFRSGIE
jgi:hypothetical protein